MSTLGPTRVLFVTESFHPVLGGGERHIRQLATRLAGSGMPCSVLTRRGAAHWPAEEWLDGVQVLRVPPVGPARAGKYLMIAPAAARLARARAQFDVAVVRGTRVLGLPALLATRWAGRALVLQPEISGEMSGEIYTWGTRWHRPPVTQALGALVRVRNRLLRDADACITISARTQAEFVDAGLDPERLICIPHGVDTERFAPASDDQRARLRADLHLPPSALVYVFTGRLLRGKGLDTLRVAFERLAAVVPDARLVIVGSGEGQALSIEAELRAQVAASSHAARVVFTGRVDDVAPWLRAADVFAFPSDFEAMPLSVIEAAACGLPCATTRVGGIPDVIEHERNGLLSAAGDPAGLLAHLLRLARTPELRRTLGAQARATVLARFDFDHTVERYRALFHELHARGSRAQRAR